MINPTKSKGRSNGEWYVKEFNKVVKWYVLIVCKCRHFCINNVNDKGFIIDVNGEGRIWVTRLLPLKQR